MLRFAYRLAIALGHVNVRRMLAQITFEELQEWRAFAELEPFDEERNDLRTAQVCRTMANMWRGKDSEAVTLGDMLLRFGDTPTPVKSVQKQSWQEQKRIAMSFVKASRTPAAPRRKKKT